MLPWKLPAAILLPQEQAILERADGGGGGGGDSWTN